MNLKVGEVAKRLGVSVKTLQRWDNEGVFVALRNPKNQRYYTEEQIENFFSKSNVKLDFMFLHCYTIFDYYEENYDKSDKEVDELIQSKKNELYLMSGEYLIFQTENKKDLSELLNIPVDLINRASLTFKEYLNGFDGGQYIEVLDTQIGCDDCVCYINENIDKYADRIHLAINNLKNDDEYLDKEISMIIDEVVSMVAKEKIDEYLKELKDMSKTGKFNWK